MAYSEVLDDEKGATCAGFPLRAAAYFATYDITKIQQVMADNHWSYSRSDDMRAAIKDLGAKHIFIKAHCPWQNGKVEQLNRTLQTEWAYAQIFYSNNERTAAPCALARVLQQSETPLSTRRTTPDQPTDTNVTAEYI